MSCEDAIARTVTGTGPVVLTAGLTTAVGLLSFVAMDIKPLRIFGIFTAIGIVATVVLSVTFIPAVIRIVGIGGADSARPFGIGILMSSTNWLSKQRKAVSVILMAITAVGLLYAGNVESRMDQSAFYSPESPPDQADRFLRDNFGGSQFIQVLVEGDLRDPVHLRRIRQLAERMEIIDHVTRVQHVGQPVALLNEMMEGQHRIPDSRPKVESLFGFLTGNPAVRQLANEERTKALLHVQIATSKAEEIDLILEEIEGEIALQTEVPFRVVPVDGPDGEAQRWEDISHRMGVRLRGAGIEMDMSRLRAAVEQPVAVADTGSIRTAVVEHLTSSEALVPVSAERAEAIADALVALGASPETEALDGAIAGVVELPVEDSLVGDLSWSVGTPLEEAWADAEAGAAVDGVVRALGIDANPDLRATLRLMLMDRRVETVAVPDAQAPQALGYTVSGLPVMHRGLSESVTANQFKSLGFALCLVAIILSAAFRSIRTGLLASAPTGLALVIIYGSMAGLGISLDIGTSMLASLIIGAGVDYAVHVLSAWYARDDEPLVMAVLRSTARVGPAVWTNALMVSVGFFVLTLGEARPLKNVGGLTSAAMLVAALVTFLVIPVLARRRHYSVEPEPEDPADTYIPASMFRTLNDQT
jgi:predicted RND superfamily exporter protein